MDKLRVLKMNIRENVMKYFTDEELIYYLEKNNNDVTKASYECLILKAETTGISVSGLQTSDMSSYFRRIASLYAPNNTGVLK